MSAERRFRSRSTREVQGPREYPKAPVGTNALLKPLAGSTIGEFNVSGQDFILILEEEGRICEGGTCVEVTANLFREEGEVIFQAHITGNDWISSWRAWNRRSTTAPAKIDLVPLDAAMDLLIERLAERGISQPDKPIPTA